MTSLGRSGWALLWPLLCHLLLGDSLFSLSRLLVAFLRNNFGRFSPSVCITPFPVWADVTGRGLTFCLLVSRDGTTFHSLSNSSSLSLFSANTWYLLLSSSGSGNICRPQSASYFFLIFQETLLQPVGDPIAAGLPQFSERSLISKGGWSSLSSSVLPGAISNTSWMSCLVPF